MTHSLEVNQIAKAIAYALNLNLDLTEAIALGHDLGHTPFGHQGERTLDDILSGKEKVGIEIDGKLLEQKCFGGFKHNYQSARILAQLEEKYIVHPGLNVSVQVIEGVLKHTKIKPKEIALEDFLEKEYLEKIEINKESEIQVCSSLEGQVVAIADEIAQRCGFQSKSWFTRKFKERFGYEIEPLMDKLYQPGYEDVYYDYMTLMSDYVLYDFYKPFTDHAHTQGAFSRSQCGGAPADLLTAFMLVDVPETEAILYEPNYGRIPASAAALAGKDVVTSETFTCLYGWRKWGGKGPHQDEEQVADMRLIADALFANGTNQIIWHGMPYNEKGKGKNDNHFYASVHVGPDAYFKDQLKDFNDYMTKVSRYMRKGKVYSDVALYLPLEDSWMGVEYPDSLQMPWVWGEYELRYVFAPDYLAGYQPLWVNAKVLSEAAYADGVLRYGDLTFSALEIDVEWLDIAALRQMVRLAKEGLPVVMAREPKQPGKNKSAEFAALYKELMALSNVSTHPAEVLKQKPLLEGEDLPDFWCRQDGEELYIFVANPVAKKLKYPLRYGQAFEDQGSVRNVVVNTVAGSQSLQLNFHPNESLMLKVNKEGKVEVIDLGFTAKKIN